MLPATIRSTSSRTEKEKQTRAVYARQPHIFVKGNALAIKEYEPYYCAK
jgi:hypothetical protein